VNRDQLRALLEEVRAGRASVEQAVERVRGCFVEDLGFARVDRHRHLRCGFPEVIYAPGKTPEQVVRIAQSLLEGGGDRVLVTRADETVRARVSERFPGAEVHPVARMVAVRRTDARPEPGGRVLVVSAGTADQPVAEEAVVTASMMDCDVERLPDVGVAGLHRLLQAREALFRARALVVVAGMEGALPSVVAGLVDRPVIAVPTSVGYGASFGGLAPLLGMLNACAPNVAVVNIDNGFGAGYIAGLIAREGAPAR
jgi:NCAIR mutase (PurE)-related protein